MRIVVASLLVSAALLMAAAGTASTTLHGTFSSGATSCHGVVSEAPAGSIDGTWNLNVKQDGQSEISLVIFRDGKQQANWGFAAWAPAADNDPGSFYHYTSVISPALTLDVAYTVASDIFVFQASHPSACIGEFHADHVEIRGSASRGS